MRRIRIALLGALSLAALVPATAEAISPRGSLFARMTGAAEVAPNVGDPDGYGSFSAITVDNRLCYGYQVNGIARPVAAHIHRGGRTANGPVVIPLRTPVAGSPGVVSGCTTVAPALMLALRANPAGYYVNVHTADRPGGAVRGQLYGSG